MQAAAVPGSPRFRARFLVLLSLLACGWASGIGGCGGFSAAPDSGSSAGGRGGTSGGLGGTGVGGQGTGGTTGGIGGAGTGGTAGSGTGGAAGAGAGGAAGDADAGTDAIVNLCGDAGTDASMGDYDFDGVIDCLDGCPMDPGKQAPGACGCGAVDFDTDNDGWADCVDACPADPTRQTAGICGCGIPDTTPNCLVHRYTFDDTTTTIADSIRNITGVSPADGMLMGNGPLPAGGNVTLAGGLSTQIGAQFVTLPAGIISKVGKNATIEAWVTWSPVTGVTDGPWQRIFDFGNSDQNAGTPGVGQTYVFLSPLNGGTRVARAAITNSSNGGETLTDATGALPINSAQPIHVAVVVNGAASQLSLYVEGAQNGPTAMMSDSAMLGRIADTNNWIGRSQWAPDQLYKGAIYEFRIYSKALTAQEIAASRAAGPDALPGAGDGGVTDGGAGGAAGTGGTAGAAGAAGTGGTAGAPGDASAG